MPFIDIYIDYDNKDRYIVFNLYFEEEIMVDLSCYLNDETVLFSIFQYNNLLTADETHIDIFISKLLNIINKTTYIC